jgi:hypothetical protein
MRSLVDYSHLCDAKEVVFEEESELETIEGEVFRETPVESIQIPASVRNIGWKCFDKCKLLK